jgi:OmpA-OmpF porin, OOP family
MKKLLSSIILVAFFFNVNSQVKSRPNGISFKALLKDYQSQNGGDIGAIKDYHYGFEIGYHRFLSEKLFLNIPFKYGNVNNTTNQNITENFKQIASLDAQFQYHFMDSKEKVSLYGLAGAGGVQELSGGMFNVQIPVGLGVNFKLADNAFINIQSEYRFSLAENRNNLHHGLGFIFYPGKVEKEVKEEAMPDSDGDGIPDKLDLCPDIAGLPQFNGCPDTDGDGVADYQDKCPKIPGLKNLNGCPDSDADGVPNNEDECPNVAGPVENKGCPVKVQDKDNDGVPDDKDKCPDVNGPASNNGCPEQKINDKDGDGIPDNVDKCPEKAGPKIYDGCPDTDGDGVPDHLDKCANTKGPVSNNGCPEITKEDKKTLDVAMRAVQFETGKATLKPESYGILKQVANILNRYPDFNLMINGHTDNVGSAVANQELSEKRAKACLEYLALQGIQKNKMNAIGYGESRPISDNNTEIGRTLNRRVEFTLIPR